MHFIFPSIRRAGASSRCGPAGRGSAPSAAGEHGGAGETGGESQRGREEKLATGADQGQTGSGHHYEGVYKKTESERKKLVTFCAAKRRFLCL